MASTYSPSLRIELIGQGEQSGTWGITTNNNLGSLIEQAITGVQTISMANATYTLTSYDGAVDQARNAVLVLTGTNLAPQDLVAPAVEKVYLISNNTGNTVNIKTSGGNAASIRDGSYAQVYCDGTDFFNATPSGNSVQGNLAVSGSITAGANITATNTITANTISATNYVGLTGRIIQTVQTNTGTQLFMTDDSQQGPFQIGFNFCFFGQTYTQFWVGSNGWISFSAAQPVTFTSQPIPTVNALVPKN